VSVVDQNDMTTYTTSHQKYTPVKTGVEEQIGSGLSGQTRLPTKVAEFDQGRGHETSSAVASMLEVTSRVFWG